MKRIVILLLWLVCILMVAGGIFVGTGYGWSLRTKPEALVLPEQAELSCAGALPIGAETAVTLRFPLPVWCRVTSAELTAPEGTVLAGPLKTDSRRRWSRRIWEITGQLRSYRAGEAKRGQIVLNLARSGKVVKESVIPIPAFYVGAETSEKPEIQEFRYAGAVDLPQHRTLRPLWLVIGIGILLILLVLWARWYFRRRRAAAEAARPFWEVTLSALSLLRGELRTHRESGEQGFVRLTDLVRGYLEKRFSLPLTTLTTPEFLEDLDRKLASELPEERPFLREFMNAADFVKFARVPADPGMLDNAVDRAEALVRRTTPRPVQEKPSADGGKSAGKGAGSC